MVRNASGTTIRGYTVEDVMACLCIEQRAFGETLSARTEYLHCVLHGHLSFVAEGTEGTVGFVKAEANREEGYVEIVSLWVAHEWRRCGIASRLIQRVIATARANHHRCVRLLVAHENTAAHALYSAAGFQETGTAPNTYFDGSGALIMELPLTETPTTS